MVNIIHNSKIRRNCSFRRN